MNYLEQLEKRKQQMVQYLLLKVEEEDWHGTADAAMDIRDIEAERIGYLNAQDETETIIKDAFKSVTPK